MSPIVPLVAFTYAYSQPDAYHFCQDSVLAPRLIAADVMARDISDLRALDVCAGCGVLGFELLHALGERRDAITSFDFVELNGAFAPHFRANLDITANLHLPTRWLEMNYTRLQSPDFRHRYDLIIANPPYFQREEGTLSENDMNNRARFFLDASLEDLLRAFANALAPSGRAYFLMKSGKKHGRDVFTRARIELFDFHLERLADVRGTDLIRMTNSGPAPSTAY